MFELCNGPQFKSMGLCTRAPEIEVFKPFLCVILADTTTISYVLSDLVNLTCICFNSENFIFISNILKPQLSRIVSLEIQRTNTQLEIVQGFFIFSFYLLFFTTCHNKVHLLLLMLHHFLLSAI